MKTNVNELIVRRMSLDAIPLGTINSLESAIQFLKDPERIKKSLEEAKKWVQDGIQAVRDAPGPNPWKNSSDEEIAGEILRKANEKDK